MIIYKTVNLINGKIYIGKDERNDPSYLGSGVLLRRAIDKYGKSNFQKIILEKCKSKAALLSREKFWIKRLDSTNSKIGYNITIGGDGGDTLTNNPNLDEIRKTLSKTSVWNSERRKELQEHFKKIFSGENNPMYGKSHSEETKKKIGSRKYATGKDHHAYGKPMSVAAKKKLSQSLKGKSGYWKGKTIPDKIRYKMSISVVQLTLDECYVKTWNSISDAQRELKLSHISGVCKGKRNQCGGYKWKYLEDYNK